MAGLDLSPPDRAHLERARELGRMGWGRVQPNPLVGCVIVAGAETVGEGYHEVFGGPHAEIVALGRAEGRTEGATAYVSLEPCSHHGKTPPCADALRDAGVQRVVYGARDPGAESGGGAEVLGVSGIEVVGPAWTDREGRAENPAFFHAAEHHGPFVALKLAMSLDAGIAARPGASTRITGPEAEREVHRLRTGFDAIMVGAGTLRTDDPRLTPRLVTSGRSLPRRLILASDGSIPADAAVFEDLAEAPVHVFVAEGTPPGATEGILERGASVHPVRSTATGLDVAEVLDVCKGLGVTSVLCEGGGRLADTLLREQRVHRLYLFAAPTTFGSAAVRAFSSEASGLVWDAFEPAFPPELHGRDTLIILDRQEA